MDILKKSLQSDRYLVAEQPGMRVLLIGLVFSFLVGYTVKSYFSPSRVSNLVTRAAQNIHKDVQVEFTGAELSFREGVLPRISVLVTGIKMESTKKCWGAPVLQVDELELPLAFFSYLSGGPLIKNIEVRKLNLVLRDVFGECSEPVTPSVTPPAPMIQLSSDSGDEKYRKDVQNLSIQELSIVAEKYAGFTLDLQKFNAHVKSHQPRVIEVEAKTHLLKDQQVGDYLSHANLYLQYQESPQIKLQSHFFGNWREGHYSLIANYLLDEKRLSVEADLKHIPLSQILALLQKYKLASKDLNGRQTWISTKATLNGPVEDLRHAPMEIRDLRLEGDIGDLKVDQIKIKSLEPLKYDPIQVQIAELDIGKLLFFLSRPQHSPTLGNLGVFSGRAEVRSEKEILLQGEHSGLEFVFSSRGQRELQVLDRVVGDIQFTGDQWRFAVQRIEPRGGNFIGRIVVNTDRDFKNIGIKSRVDEVVLDPKVQSVMTNGGEIGPLSLDVEARLQEGQMTHLRGLGRLDEIEIEGLSLEKVKTHFDWSHGELLMNTQAKGAQIIAQSAVGRELKSITLPQWWQQDELKLLSVSGTFATKNLNTLAWRHFQASISKTARLTAEGSWDGEGNLKGSVQNRDGKIQRAWSVQGTRSNPIFSEGEGR